jgi:hypothetical protein
MTPRNVADDYYHFGGLNCLQDHNSSTYFVEFEMEPTYSNTIHNKDQTKNNLHFEM